MRLLAVHLFRGHESPTVASAMPKHCQGLTAATEDTVCLCECVCAHAGCVDNNKWQSASSLLLDGIREKTGVHGASLQPVTHCVPWVTHLYFYHSRVHVHERRNSQPPGADVWSNTSQRCRFYRPFRCTLALTLTLIEMCVCLGVRGTGTGGWALVKLLWVISQRCSTDTGGMCLSWSNIKTTTTTLTFEP